MDFKSRLKQIVFENNAIVPTPMPNEPVLMEPQPPMDDSGLSDENLSIDLFEIYPGLVDVDITCPCAIADFFAALCEEKMADDEMNMRQAMVPSLNDMGTEDEF